MAKILVVDDEPGMRRILNVNLRRDSHVVVEAAGASEAIERIDAFGRLDDSGIAPNALLICH